MRTLKVERTVAAPRASVWAVLADYPNIADWNDGVLRSEALGDVTEGVGARRRCELAPKGSMRMRETVTAWEPEDRMVIAIDEIEKQPVKAATMTFTLADEGGDTRVAMSYDFEPKGGPLSGVLGSMMTRPMNKGFNGFIDGLEEAARDRAVG